MERKFCTADFYNKKVNILNILKELESAKIVEPEAMPSNVVTMNSIVKLSFINNTKQVQFQIVYPNQANLKENKISIFSPIATALQDKTFYHFVSDGIQLLCEKANIYPCVLDAAIFSSAGGMKKTKANLLF